MLDIRVNGVNIFNPIDGKIDEIIEYFVKFYGEEHRKRITDRINDTTFIFTSRKINEYSSTTESVKNYYEDKIKYINHLLFSSIQNYKPKYEPNFKSIEDVFEVKKALDYDVFDYKTYDKITDMVEMFGLEDSRFPLEDYAHTTIDSWLNNDFNRNNINNCLNKIIDNYEKKYKKIILDNQAEKDLALKKLQKYDDLMQIVERKLEAKLYDIAKDYLLKNIPILQFADKKVMQNCVDTLITLAQYGKEHFVNNNDFARYEVVMITNFFKAVGFDLGDEISAYQNNEKALEFVFNQDLYNTILEEYKSNAILSCKANPYLQDALNTISTLNIKGGNIYHASLLFNFMYNNACAGATMINYVEKNTNKFKHICIFPDAVKISDIYLIHELNHVIESDLLYYDDKKHISKTGFEVLETEYINEDFSLDEISASTNEIKRVRRNTEIINEVINDYFAIQVAQNMKNDQKILTFGKTSKSAYSVCHGAFKNFIESNKDKLIEMRFSKEQNIFEKFVGKENLDKLSRICEILVEYEQNYSDYMWDVKCEISGNTNIPIKDVFTRYKEYINKDDIIWSRETKQILNLFEKLDYILENIDNKQNCKYITK